MSLHCLTESLCMDGTLAPPPASLHKIKTPPGSETTGFLPPFPFLTTTGAGQYGKARPASLCATLPFLGKSPPNLHLEYMRTKTGS